VIVHGWIVKGGLELVKKIVGGKSGLKLYLDSGLVNLISAVKELYFIPRGEG
jgi:hypothetical protein